jgi:hypothetical protein
MLGDGPVTITRDSAHLDAPAGGVDEVNICSSSGSHEDDRTDGRAGPQHMWRHDGMFDEYHLPVGAKPNEVAVVGISLVDNDRVRNV